jgi:hypothetical protein
MTYPLTLKGELGSVPSNPWGHTMKILIAAVLMMGALSTFGAELGAVDAFESALPVGTYQGQDDQGVNCSVSVNEINSPVNTIVVTVSNNNNSVFKEIKDGSEFRYRDFKKEFIQTERTYVDATRNAFVDRIVRTTLADDNRLYVVTSNVFTNNRDVRSETVECVVGLN